MERISLFVFFLIAGVYSRQVEWLFQAIKVNDIERVKRILARGVDLNIAGEHGDTPLHVAARYGRLEIVKYLIGNGAEANIKMVLLLYTMLPNQGIQRL